MARHICIAEEIFKDGQNMYTHWQNSTHPILNIAPAGHFLLLHFVRQNGCARIACASFARQHFINVATQKRKRIYIYIYIYIWTFEWWLQIFSSNELLSPTFLHSKVPFSRYLTDLTLSQHHITLDYESNQFCTDALQKWCKMMTAEGIARILKPHYSKLSLEKIKDKITLHENGDYEIQKIILDAFVLYFSRTFPSSDSKGEEFVCKHGSCTNQATFISHMRCCVRCTRWEGWLITKSQIQM